MYMRKYLPVIVFLLGLGWMTYSRVPAGFGESQVIRSPQVGFLAPAYTGVLVDGGELTAADIAGTPVVLNIWASWCPPCRAEMPTLQKMSLRYENAGVRFIGVNSTVQDSTENARAFLAENHITFSQVMDVDGSITHAYGIDALPATYFIAPNGKITAIVLGGPISEASLVANIAAMLQEAP